MERDILILAASEKYANYCVAGIDIKTDEWIRPYSSRKDIMGAVPTDQIICNTGNAIKIADVVRILFTGHCNNEVQPENYFYYERTWKYIEHWDLDQLFDLHKCDERDKIFFNYDRRLTQEEIDAVKPKNKESLLLLRINNAQIVVKMRDNRKKFYLNFNYNGKNYYDFAVGDINIRQMYQNQSVGAYNFCDTALVVFSLTDKYKDDRYYKMAAQFVEWK